MYIHMYDTQEYQLKKCHDTDPRLSSTSLGAPWIPAVPAFRCRFQISGSRFSPALGHEETLHLRASIPWSQPGGNCG